MYYNGDFIPYAHELKQKDSQKFEELKSEVTIDALNKANAAYLKSFEQLETMLKSQYLEDALLDFCNKKPIKGLASYLENHQEITYLLRDNEKRENIKYAIINKSENQFDIKVKEFISKFSNIDINFKTNRDIFNKFFEVLPNLDLLKGLEKGNIFKEEIKDVKNFIENRMKEIKLKEIEKEKGTLFTELRNIYDNSKNEMNKAKINEVRGLRFSKLDRILELSKQQYKINHLYEQKINTELIQESERSFKIKKGDTAISFILEGMCQKAKPLLDPRGDPSYAIKKFKSFVEQEKERERLEETKTQYLD